MKCPKCGSTELRRSRHGRWNDIIFAPLGQRAWRCRSCHVRFHAADSAESPEAVSSKRHHTTRHVPKRLRRRLVEAAVFIVMLILFLLFLRYLTREQPPASEPESGSSAVRFPA